MNNYNSSHSLKAKYSYEPWTLKYRQLFQQESEEISQALVDVEVGLSHIGSTAVEGLGGKGVIDILMICQLNSKRLQSQLDKIGYLYRPQAGSDQRKFFHKIKPDQQNQYRRYHLHLCAQWSDEAKAMIKFRDELKQNQNLRNNYDSLKRKASQESLKFLPDKQKMKQVYLNYKNKFIKELTKKLEVKLGKHHHFQN